MNYIFINFFNQFHFDWNNDAFIYLFNDIFISIMFVTFHPPFVLVWCPPSRERLGLRKSFLRLKEFSWNPNGSLLLYVSTAAIKEGVLNLPRKTDFKSRSRDHAGVHGKLNDGRGKNYFCYSLFFFFHCLTVAVSQKNYLIITG